MVFIMVKIRYEPDLKFLDNSCTHSLPDVEIDPTADIHPNVVFRGKVKIGPYCQIEAGVLLVGEVRTGLKIGHHSIVKANSTLRGEITVGNNVIICEQVNIEGGRPGDYLGSALSAVPDRAIVGDGTIIGPGSAMHGAVFGNNCVIGMKCSFDYNTRIGNGCVIDNGSATNVDQLIPDNCYVASVPARVVKYDITDCDRMALLGFLPHEQAKITYERLNERYKLDMTQKEFISSTVLNIAPDAYVHPTAVLNGKITIGSNAVVDAGSILIGEIDLGSDARIALNAVIKGAVSVGKKTNILSHTVIDASCGYNADIKMAGTLETITIGNNCFIDQGAVIRGSCLENNVMMGQISGCDFGSFIQENAAVASGSIVDRDTVVGKSVFVEGLPAIIKRCNITEENKVEYFGFSPSARIAEIIKDQAKIRAEKAAISNINIHPGVIVGHNVWFEGNINIGQYTHLDVGSVLCGDITIGYNCLVRCNVSVEGKLVVGEKVHIYDQICFSGDCCVGDYGWMNHGAVVNNTKIGDECAVAVGAATEYGSSIEDGAIVSNHSIAFPHTAVKKNTRIEGIPSVVVQRFMDQKDRQCYFGVSPYQWVVLQGSWIEQDVKDRDAGK